MVARIKGNSISYLRNICEKKLQDYFPAGVPTEVNNRLVKELSYIDKAGDADLWRVYYEFNETARKCNSIIGVVRTSRGNSIITFLLGNAPIDPMEPYYYCKKCGHYERVKNCAFGIDAEDKNCPTCGEKLLKRGFDLPEVFTWGNQDILMSGDFCYEYPRCLRAFLFSKLKKLYSNNEVMPVYDNYVDSFYCDGKENLVAFAVLPDGTDAKGDFPEFISYTKKGKIAFSGIQYEMEERDIIFIPLLEHDILNKIMKMQEETGTFFTELEGRKKFIPRDFVNTGFLSEEEKSAMSLLNRASIFEITELFSIAHNTFAFSDEEDIEDTCQINKDVLRNDSYELPVNRRFFTRETLYEELLIMGIDPNDAYSMTQLVRKGKARARTDQWKIICEKYNLPEDFTTFCEDYKYMCPRFLALERTYLLSICVRYFERYPELYFEKGR